MGPVRRSPRSGWVGFTGWRPRISPQHQVFDAGGNEPGLTSKEPDDVLKDFRLLDLGSYRTGWFMAHRIREAMREKGLLTPLSGDVEADETYLHPRRRRGSRAHHERIKGIEMGIRPAPRRKGPYEGKAIVFGMQERDGKVRTVHVPDATSQTLHPRMETTL